MTLIGIDTGGTFTDFVVWSDKTGVRVHKVLSTPDAPERAILQGIAELTLDPGSLQIIHGSTVATNAVLEGKGVRTAYITNRGFADLLTIGRQARADLYELQPAVKAPPVPAELCLETGGRVGADGSVLDPLTESDVAALNRDLERLAPESVAINLLFSYLDDRAERALERALPGGLFVSRSSEVLPVTGEYERGIATWLNAWVGPLVARYVGRLCGGLPGARVSVMQSSGEAISAHQTARQAVRLLLSGPAGGLIGAGFVGRVSEVQATLSSDREVRRRSGEQGTAPPRDGTEVSARSQRGGEPDVVSASSDLRSERRKGPPGEQGACGEGPGVSAQGKLLTFDMGGTSTDVALLDGDPRLTSEGKIAGYPVAVPMMDMHTIGAGGGSIARLDPGGMLLVGPESAGADPGPACYGKGGQEPTVTDANLVLGRLRANAFLGGRMNLDQGAAVDALRRLGVAMRLAPPEVALGIVRVANEHMVRALRVISVQRGIDPRAFVLVSFGGAGGLHVCALAEALGMSRAMVPVHAGVLSALGMLVAPPGRLLTRTWLGELSERQDPAIIGQLDELAQEGRRALHSEGQAPESLRVRSSLDLRYKGQSYTLNVPWQGRVATERAFHALHEQRYGHALDLPVELVNLRVRVTAPPLPLRLPAARIRDQGGSPSLEQAEVFGCDGSVPILPRAELDGGARLAGPAVIVDSVATTWLSVGWEARLDQVGNLRLQRSLPVPEVPGSRF